MNDRINYKMLKYALTIIMIATSLFATAFAVNYSFEGLYFDFKGKNSDLVSNEVDTIGQIDPYGMVVDPEGKIWVGFRDGFSNEVNRNASDKIRLTGLRCYLPDTTEASFSPVELIEFPGGGRDTLYIGNPMNGFCRGISKDSDGNILYTAGPTLYMLDFHDGSGIAKFDPGMIDKPIRTHIAAVQDCSLIYFAPYPQYEQVNVLDEDLNFIRAALPLTQTIQNAIAVRTRSNGVTQLFSATHLNGIGILVYESSDPASQAFALVDTIGNFTEETDTNTITYYAWANFMEWVDKEAGIMIFGNDYRAQTSVSSGQAPENYLAASWVALDVENDEILYWTGKPWFDLVGGEAKAKEVNDQIPDTYLNGNAMCMIPSGAVSVDETPSGFYLTDMGLNCIQSVSLETGINDVGYIPYQLELQQNYPNPFNPLTTINFKLERSQNISLKIYDLNGKIVLNIFEGYLESGSHQIKINGAQLPSGTYIYTLHTKDLSVSRKMTLLK